METTNLLAGYVDRATLAQQLKCSERTIARYESVTNGLPSTMIAGRKLYRLASVQEWLLARELRPNRRRAA